MKIVEIISVPVTDQQKSKEFYLKMGLSLVRENPFANGQNWVELGFPDGGSNITLVTWFDKMPAGSLQGVVIACADIEKEISRLNDNQISTGKLDETPWGKFVSVTDPDGNSWSLHQH